LEKQYPGLFLSVSLNAAGEPPSLLAQSSLYQKPKWARSSHIHIQQITVPKELQGQGIGTKVIMAIQEFAKSVGLPITLMPSPEPRMKAKLYKFYTSLGFRPNKGRHKDYSLSSFFGATLVWRPT